PAGVDSSIAIKAASLAKHLFVPWPQQQRAQQKADSAKAKVEQSNKLWEALMANEDSLALAAKDTVLAIQKYNEGARRLKEAISLQQESNSDQEQIKQQVLAHLEGARGGFEEAIMLNPFDSSTRLWLARVYQMLAKRFLSVSDWQKAAEVLENLVRIERGQHGLYARLGQCYLSLKKWDNALRNFQKAESVLRNTAIFRVPDDQPIDDKTIAAALDSSALFIYVYNQAESNIRLYRADSALTHLEGAFNLARNENDRTTVKATIDWVEWDNGNILASEMRDSLLTLVDEKQYIAAANGFQNLLPNLRTDRTQREINWRLALLEFSFLRKEEQALNRMQKVVNFYAQDTTGVTVEDTLKNQYYMSYGTMCHNQGLKALREKKLLEALVYFEQSISVPWKQRAKSQLEIAKLSINNAKRAKEAATLALADREQLTTQEQLDALKLLIESLKRLGKPKEAEPYFYEYRKLSQQVQENAATKNP
ncbi:MAG: hypothetical protein ACE5HX_03025, partial [bacterium]